MKHAFAPVFHCAKVRKEFKTRNINYHIIKHFFSLV